MDIMLKNRAAENPDYVNSRISYVHLAQIVKLGIARPPPLAACNSVFRDGMSSIGMGPGC
jgi:hypothetical protein